MIPRRNNQYRIAVAQSANIDTVTLYCDVLYAANEKEKQMMTLLTAAKAVIEADNDGRFQYLYPNLCKALMDNLRTAIEESVMQQSSTARGMRSGGEMEEENYKQLMEDVK